MIAGRRAYFEIHKTLWSGKLNFRTKGTMYLQNADKTDSPLRP